MVKLVSEKGPETGPEKGAEERLGKSPEQTPETCPATGSNILTFPRRSAGRMASGAGASDGVARLLSGFARHRRLAEDVMWLKENAELLNILECTGARLATGALAEHEEFLVTAWDRLQFFPQYYRFLLSIALDLEDLGLRLPSSSGTGAGIAENMVHWAHSEGLARAELSDLQRAEARRLMLRRGYDPFAQDTGLNDRLRAFTAQSAVFALPNKKAAYELTHIVFYLSEYGRRDPDLPAEAALSLEFAGLLAFLEQNGDLLAEITLAMRFAGLAVPPLWDGWLSRETARFEVYTGPQTPLHDDYHAFLVMGWAAAARKGEGFAPAAEGWPAGERLGFVSPSALGTGALRGLSETLLEMGAERSADWTRMRGRLERALPPSGRGVLAAAASSVPDFERFFALFARTGDLGAGDMGGGALGTGDLGTGDLEGGGTRHSPRV